MLRGLTHLAKGLAIWLALSVSGAAQTGFQSTILTIDPERMIAESQLGQALVGQVDVDSAALAQENRRIEAELIAEEQTLTEQRPTLPADEFRALADAFDTKVQRIRAEQDRKGRELITLRESKRQEFLNNSLPVLAAIISDRGAVALLNRSDVFLSADAIDVTDEAIARIDSGFSAGEVVSEPEGAAEDLEPVPTQQPKTPESVVDN